MAVLFGLLLLASQSNELLKQVVIAPGSSAELGIDANCRADELIEEEISLQECRLMVSNVQIVLASSPAWFRPLQIWLSAITCIGALVSIGVGFGFVNNKRPGRLASLTFLALIILDIAGFVAAINTGPLLRAQYLSPLFLWFCIHLCFFIVIANQAAVNYSKNNSSTEAQASEQ